MHRGFTGNRWEDLIDISVECCKRRQFPQMTLFVVFFSFILAPDTWSMMNNLVRMRKLLLACIILITEVVKKTSSEANCNLQPDECTVCPATKYERPTMCTVHSTRCRPALKQAGNIPLQLLWCTFDNRSGPRISSGISLHVCGYLLRIGSSLVIAGKT